MATTSNLVAAANHNFELYRGDSWNCQLVFTDSNSDPIDLSEATLRMQIKTAKGVSASVKQLTIGSGLTLSGAGSNVVTINTSVDMEAKKSYVYDLEAAFSDNTITYLKGTITVQEDVTR